MLRGAALGRMAEMVSRAGVVLLGLLAGFLWWRCARRTPQLLWLALMAGAFTAGLMVGERAWRPAALLAVGTVVSILTVAARWKLSQP